MASEIVPSSKRPASPPANGALVVKRQRTDGELGTAEQVGLVRRPCSMAPARVHPVLRLP